MSKLDRIDVTGDGILLIRFIKDDGLYHRTSIPPEIDADRQMDEVDKHLQAMGYGKVPVTERAVIKERHTIEKQKVSRK